jgi:hypothetical protein
LMQSMWSYLSSTSLCDFIAVLTTAALALMLSHDGLTSRTLRLSCQSISMMARFMRTYQRYKCKLWTCFIRY